MKKNILFFMVAWLGIIVLNVDCLENPPYWDDLMGLHAQAMWYVNHDFNVWRLWLSPATYESSNIYPLGVLPLLYGVMYKVLPPLAVHVTGHLFNMACLALCLVVCYRLVRRYQPWYIALIAGLTAITEPIIAGQSAALGQECPLALLTILSIRCFFRKRYMVAYGWAIAAFLIKFTGIILLLAYVVYWSGILAVYYWKRKRLGRLRRQWVFAGLIFLLCLVGISFFYTPALAPKETLGIAGLVWRTVAFSGYYCPLLMFKILAALVGFVWIFWNSRGRNSSLLPLILPAIFCGGFCLALFGHVLPLPRYLTTIIFPVTVLLFAILPRHVALIGGVLFIAVQVFNFNGIMYPQPKVMQRSGALMERSREYLGDLNANRRICRWLEENAGERPIIAKWPFTHMLTVPEFRYVDKPLGQVYCPSLVHDCCRGAKVFNNDVSQLPSGTLCLYADNDFEYMYRSIRLVPNSAVKIIYRDDTMPGDLMIYELPRQK